MPLNLFGRDDPVEVSLKQGVVKLEFRPSSLDLAVKSGSLPISIALRDWRSTH